MGSKKKQTVGYRYYANAHMVLCHGPIDAITKISFSEKDAYTAETSSNSTITIDKPSLFGGADQQGGISGKIDLMFGHSDQAKNTKLQAICAKISDSFGGVISAWRGVTSVFLDNLYIGTSPNMPDSKWRVKRIHTRHDGEAQWYDGKAEINPNQITGSIDSYYKYQVQDGFTALSQLAIYASETYNDASWITGQGPFGAGSDPTLPTLNTYISPQVGRSIMIRQIFNVLNTDNFGDLKINLKHDDGGALYWNGEQIPLTEDSYYISHATIPNEKIKLGKNVLFCAAVDSVPAGAPGIYLYLEYSNEAIGAIEADINPAHIIRECLTNPIWGIGIAESNIDDTSFMLAADTLYAEGMGMSIKWTDLTAISEFVDTVKQHINAQLYLDRITNKWKLYLIRDDYDQETLITVDEGVIQDLEFERRTLAECTNTVTITYYDREKSGDSTVSVQDIARIAQQGGVIAQSIEYTGFSNSDIAGRVALRELKTLSSTLASVSFNISEALSNDWHIGMPFKLSDSNYGLEEAIMRVTAIKFGNGISNTVYVEAVEDSFSSPAQAVVEYVPPIVSDSAAKDTTAIAFEVPFIELVEQYGQDEINAKLLAESDLGFVGMAAIRPNNLHINASLYSDSGAGYDEEANLDFCPAATLVSDLNRTDASFEIENLIDIDLIDVGTRIQLNGELMGFVNFDSETNMLTVKRGCFDTVPQVHAVGSVLYGWDNYSGLDSTEYLSGETINLKALTLTGSDALSLSEATVHSVTLGSRAIRPYPPADVQINGEYFPDEIDTDLIISWVDRNRQQQTGGSPLSWFDAGVVIEPDTSTYLNITEYNSTLVELATNNVNVTAAGMYTMVMSSMQADTKFIEVTLKTVKNGYECLQPYIHSVEISQFFSAPYNLNVGYVE